MKDMTIIICSYNYERYIRDTIDSALRQEPARTKVIVIDDGSSDGSRAIIESYGERLTAVFKENEGQASAYNQGLALADTEYLIYLDSDDVLYDGAVRQVLDAFERGGYAKVQFTLDVIAQDGSHTGAYVPNSQPPVDCRKLLKSGWLYPSPPASGNAYRVSALRKILPIPLGSGRRIAADFYAIYGVAMVGEIHSIDKPLGGYRVHRSFVADEHGGAPKIGLSIANCQDINEVVSAFPQRWNALRELVAQRLGEALPPQGVDFSYEKARLCAEVYEAPLAKRWHWFAFESRHYFRSVFGNPFWGTGKKLGAFALTALCLVPSRRLSDHVVRYIANPLARQAHPGR
jgi:glycosyltransferase involved in cell wall biosynthesis